MTTNQIVFKEGRYFVREWFFSGVRFDWLCALWRDLPDGLWTVQYRFRYVVDDEIGYESDDEKSWWTATLPAETKEVDAETLTQKLAEQIRAMRMQLSRESCSELESVPFHSANVQENFTTLTKQKWAHVIPTQKGGSASARRSGPRSRALGARRRRSDARSGSPEPRST